MISRNMVFGKPDGLFLAAPRRTGKSTFLRYDLIPVLEERGDLVLYVDLWEEKDVDPAQVIMACLVNAIHELGNPVSKLTKLNPFSGIGFFGVSAQFKSSKSWTGSISNALSTISQRAKKDIVLIIDEAQQSLETEAGKNAMYALKSARDAINQSRSDLSLFLVMTGSHRDKLYSLMNRNRTPFYGSYVLEFPVLGMEFSQVITKQFNNHLKPESQISAEVVDGAFESIGRRPEVLKECLDKLFLVSEKKGDDALRNIVEEKRRDIDREIISDIKDLSSLHIAVLKKICIDRFTFPSFSEDIGATLAGPGIQEIPSIELIQDVLDHLCEKDFVWKNPQDRYVIADPDIKNVLMKFIENELDIKDPDVQLPGF